VPATTRPLLRPLLVLAWPIVVSRSAQVVVGVWVSVRVLGGGELAAVGWLVLYLALLAGALWLRFRGGAWRRIVLVELGPA